MIDVFKIANQSTRNYSQLAASHKTTLQLDSWCAAMFSKTSRVFRHFAHTIMPPRRTRDERAAIQIMFRAGFRPWRISRRLGIPYETVRRWIGRGNDTDERPRRRVSTRTIRRAMMMLYVGETLRSSARILGISHMTVWRRARRSERNRRGFIPYKIRRRLRLNTVQKQK